MICFFKDARGLGFLLICLMPLLAAVAQAADPKIAVSDLSYDERVREFIQNFEMKGGYRSSSSASASFRDSDFSASGRSAERTKESANLSIRSSSGYQTYIDRGEIRKFTADIKGGLLRAGYRVVQGKPWVQANTEKLYDIIGRIRQGYYPGADYVLWGSINSIEFRRDSAPLQGSNAVSYTMALELVGEFSLINTKTYEIKAAFSAQGEGSDTKLSNAAATTISFNRGKIVQEVSRSLGDAVVSEVESQFSREMDGSGAHRGLSREASAQEDRVLIYK